MTRTRYVALSIVLLLVTALSVSAQEAAPSISGTSVQGTEIDLSTFKNDKNVLVVFYRMHT